MIPPREDGSAFSDLFQLDHIGHQGRSHKEQKGRSTAWTCNSSEFDSLFD